MEVRASDKAPVGWGRLVEADPAGTFFHTTEWGQTLVEAGFGEACLYLCVGPDEDLVAGLPAVWIRRGPVRILASMPLGTYGGPLLSPAAPREATGLLVDAFARASRRPDVGASHLMDEAGRLEGAPRGFSTHAEQAHRIRLDGGFDDVWSGFRPSARNKVRKAQKAGVSVRRASSESDFLVYADMLAECAARWGEPSVFGRDFFSLLSTLDRDLVQMWLAEHEGEVIGGDLNFVMHRRIMNWGNVSRTSARSLAPNNLLHAAAMEEGAAAGAVEYDLGSSAGIEGVDSFKSAFGTTLVTLRRYSARKWWYRAARALAERFGHGGNG